VEIPGRTVIWTPQAGPQSWATACPYQEVFFGGSPGGGKTDWLIGDFLAGVYRYGAAWHGMIFRRSYTQLDEIEKRLLEICTPIFGPKFYNRSNHVASFPTGATLKLRYLESDNDAFEYLGKQYSWVGWDELTQWPSDFSYKYIFSRVRSPMLAPDGQRVPCYYRATSNPGGPGHAWVKGRFMEPNGVRVPPMTPIREVMPSGREWFRVFIPSRMQDNKILMDNDPSYLDRVQQISDPELRRAYLQGDWDIFQGAMFSQFNRAVHVIPHHEPPRGVPMWRSCDWGRTRPYAVHWYYSDNAGDVHVFNEMYGWGGESNKGSEEDPETVREKIEAYEQQHNIWIPYGWLDPQCWEKDDSPVRTSERLGGAKLGWRKAQKGPHSRVVLCQNVHEWLKVVNGRSRLKIHDNCYHLIRTLPSLQRDPGNTEDVDSDGEDHAFDSLKMGLSTKVLTRQQNDRIASIQRDLERQAEAEDRLLAGGGW